MNDDRCFIITGDIMNKIRIKDCINSQIYYDENSFFIHRKNGGNFQVTQLTPVIYRHRMLNRLCSFTKQSDGWFTPNFNSMDRELRLILTVDQDAYLNIYESTLYRFVSGRIESFRTLFREYQLNRTQYFTTSENGRIEADPVIFYYDNNWWVSINTEEFFKGRYEIITEINQFGKPLIKNLNDLSGVL